jgi:hypothetical protein
LQSLLVTSKVEFTTQLHCPVRLLIDDKSLHVSQVWNLVAHLLHNKSVHTSLIKVLEQVCVLAHPILHPSGQFEQDKLLLASYTGTAKKSHAGKEVGTSTLGVRVSLLAVIKYAMKPLKTAAEPELEPNIRFDL